MTIEQWLDTALKSDSILTTALGGRIYWLQATQTANTPYLVYFTAADSDQPVAFDKTNTGIARVQFDIVSQNKADKASMYRVRHLLRGKRGDDIGGLFPSETLTPSATLYPKDNISGVDVITMMPLQIRERFDAGTMRYIFTFELEITFAY